MIDLAHSAVAARVSRRVAGSLAGILSLIAYTGADAQSVPQRSYSTPLWTSSEGFTAPPSVRLLRDGRLIVADAGAREVWLLGADGKRVRQIGRAGPGPEEYMAPLTVFALRGDSSLLVDRGLGRFVLIGPDAGILDTYRFPQGAIDGAASAVGADSLGGVIFPATIAPIDDANVPLLRWDRATGRLDTLTRIRIPLPQLVPLARGSFARRDVLFAPQDGWAVLGDGSVVVARVQDYHLDFVSPRGTLRSGPAVPYTPVQVTDEDRAQWKGFPSAATKPGFDADRVVASADADGEVWVGRYGPFGASHSDWDVFNSAGQRIGTVRLPKGRRAIALSRTHVYMTRLDDDGLRWIESYKR